MILLSHYMPSRYTLYDIDHILAILINIFFKKWGIPTSFCLIRVFFKQTLQFLKQIHVKKCPSRMQYWDSNPQPSEHESLPSTTITTIWDQIT